MLDDMTRLAVADLMMICWMTARLALLVLETMCWMALERLACI